MRTSIEEDIVPGSRGSSPIAIPDHIPSGRRQSIFALAAAAFVDSSEGQALSILWPSIYRSLGVSVGRLGSVLGISELVNTLALPFWGFAADRFSRKALLVWITGIWGLWTLGIGFVETLPQLYLVRILSSLGLGVFIPATFSLIGDLFTDKERGRISGIINAVNLIGVTVAFSVLPLLAEGGPDSWRIAFIAIGLASFVTGILLWFLLDEPPRGAGEPELEKVLAQQTAVRYRVSWGDILALLQIRSWVWLALKEILEVMSLTLLSGWAFTWLDSLGLGESAIIVILLMFLSIVVGAVFFGWASDRLERRFPNRGRITLVWIGLLISLPTVILLVTADGSSLPLLALFGILFGVGSTASGDSVMWPVIQGILPPELRGSGRALINMGKGAVSALMLTLSGLLADQVGVGRMLLYVIPGPLFISILTWLPLFRAYSHDRQALHNMLEQRQVELSDEAG